MSDYFTYFAYFPGVTFGIVYLLTFVTVHHLAHFDLGSRLIDSVPHSVAIPELRRARTYSKLDDRDTSAWTIYL